MVMPNRPNSSAADFGRPTVDGLVALATTWLMLPVGSLSVTEPTCDDAPPPSIAYGGKNSVQQEQLADRVRLEGFSGRVPGR